MNANDKYLKEFNKLIIENVLGLDIFCYQDRPTSAPYFSCKKTGRNWDQDEQFSPATDIAWAFEVAEKLGSLVLLHCSDGMWEASFNEDTVGVANTAAMAICRASLRACKVEIPAGGEEDGSK